MKQITSLHVSDNHIRILTLSQSPIQSVKFCLALNLPTQTFPPDFTELELANKIPATSGSLIITLGGTFFHIQRVPLEVASEPDRKAQINWEASQVLIDPVDNFDINFIPAGRVAFWTAIRKKIIQTYTDFFLDLGFDQVTFVVEPLALYGLNKYIQTLKSQGAIWLGDKWGSFISHTDNALTTAETIDLQTKSHSAPQRLTQIKKWTHGDLNTERRRPAFDDILLCGESEPLADLSATLTEYKNPHIIPFDWAKHAPDIEKATEVPPSNAFALALGAAMIQGQ